MKCQLPGDILGRVRSGMSRLDSRDRLVLDLSFGFSGKVATQKEIAALIGVVSTDRVSQIRDRGVVRALAIPPENA